MITTATSEDRPFNECVRLMVELHHLSLAGDDDAIGADQVRDEMDHYWHRMTKDQISLLRGLSADLYTLEDEAAPNGELRPGEGISGVGDLELFRTAYQEGRYREALELVRQSQALLTAGAAALLRGAMWAQLGFPAVAAEFLAHAYRLQPDDATIAQWLFAVLPEAGRLDEAVLLAREWIQPGRTAEARLAALAPVFLQAEYESADPCAAHGAALRTADEVIRSLPPVLGDNARAQLVNVRLHAAISHIHLDDLERAREECGRALQLEPRNATALQLLGGIDALRSQVPGFSREELLCVIPHARGHDTDPPRPRYGIPLAIGQHP